MKPEDFIYDEEYIKGKLLSLDSPDRLSLIDENFIPSAITFLIIPYEDKPYDLVLIRRSIRHEDKHSGEMSFPGGKCESNDKSSEETALRECEEELGIPRGKIHVLGSFNDHLTPRKYIITPIVACVGKDQPMKKQDDEVHQIVKIPVSFFAEKKNYRERSYKLDGDTVAVGKYNYIAPNDDKFLIYGATCHLIVDFMDSIYETGLKAPGVRRLTPTDFKKHKLLSRL